MNKTTMDEIACRETVPELWTDKRSAKAGFICHDYYRIYEREWSKWRDEPIRLMEIGLNRGASIKVWLEYFTNAHVIGVDINQFKNEVGISDLSRFTFVQGDQSDTVFWDAFKLQQDGPLDVIIDDGCHFSGPIHTAFKCLWPHVKPGGYYVVEDITEVRNPESRTAGFPNQVEFVNNLIEPVIFGSNDIDEVMVSKDLCVLRKKL
jgi:SAM-dependent methyltransferase